MLFTIRPKGTAAVAPAPELGSPLKRIPAWPLLETMLFITTTPGTRRLAFSTDRFRTAPGSGAFVPASRAAASIRIPKVAAEVTALLSMMNCPCSRGWLSSPRSWEPGLMKFESDVFAGPRTRASCVSIMSSGWICTADESVAVSFPNSVPRRISNW